MAEVVDLNQRRTERLHAELDMRTCTKCSGHWFFSTIALDTDGTVMGRKLGIICSNCGEESDV